jgi:hypothetical protein
MLMMAIFSAISQPKANPGPCIAEWCGDFQKQTMAQKGKVAFVE